MTKKWTTLRHNGPYFPKPYESHNKDIYLNGSKVSLPLIAEEYLTMYARYLDTDYVKKNRFNKNFLSDLKKVLPKSIKVNSMDEFDLSQVKKYLDDKKERMRSLSKETKQKLKEKQQQVEEPYSICYIDGQQQKVGNYKIEPPGIFLGRGEHPKLGKIKPRVNPEDVMINLDKSAPVPEPNVGGKWDKVIHDPEVVWLAMWIDTVTGKNKYVFTSMEGTFKAASDEKKFNLARKLKRNAGKIRKQMDVDMKSESTTDRQLATALYFIDKMALRVGGKKNKNETADTVGVTSLRVEHIDMLKNNTIKLDFLGKDSIRFCKKIKVDKVVYDNLCDFIKGKNKKDDLFDRIDAPLLNDYLTEFMKDLTAKVWRTYNASVLFQKELNKVNQKKLEKMPENERILYLVSFFNSANTAVALLCNHQKNVASDISGAVKKMNEQLKKLRQQKRNSKKNKKNADKLKKLEAKIETLKLKKDTKEKMKNVSLGTSKTNYIDPRIIFAFIKKYDIPPEKLFTKQLLKRFEWASKVDKDYTF